MDGMLSVGQLKRIMEEKRFAQIELAGDEDRVGGHSVMHIVTSRSSISVDTDEGTCFETVGSVVRDDPGNFRFPEVYLVKTQGLERLYAKVSAELESLGLAPVIPSFKGPAHLLETARNLPEQRDDEAQELKFIRRLVEASTDASAINFISDKVELRVLEAEQGAYIFGALREIDEASEAQIAVAGTNYTCSAGEVNLLGGMDVFVSGRFGTGTAFSSGHVDGSSTITSLEDGVIHLSHGDRSLNLTPANSALFRAIRGSANVYHKGNFIATLTREGSTLYGHASTLGIEFRASSPDAVVARWNVPMRVI